jgi:hypothetical protein
MGFDWPLSPLWLVSLFVLLTIALWIHGRALLKSTLAGLAWKLIVLRSLAAILFLILISRPFITTEEPDPSRMKLLVLSDLSGSMDARDDRDSPRRISKVQPFLSVQKQERTRSFILDGSGSSVVMKGRDIKIRNKIAAKDRSTINFQANPARVDFKSALP